MFHHPFKRGKYMYCIPTIETNIKYAITASFEYVYSGIRVLVAIPLCKARSPTAAAFGCAHVRMYTYSATWLRDFVRTITKPAGGVAMHSDKASSAGSFR